MEGTFDAMSADFCSFPFSFPFPLDSFVMRETSLDVFIIRDSLIIDNFPDTARSIEEGYDVLGIYFFVLTITIQILVASTYFPLRKPGSVTSLSTHLSLSGYREIIQDESCIPCSRSYISGANAVAKTRKCFSMSHLERISYTKGMCNSCVNMKLFYSYMAPSIFSIFVTTGLSLCELFPFYQMIFP